MRVRVAVKKACFMAARLDLPGRFDDIRMKSFGLFELFGCA